MTSISAQPILTNNSFTTLAKRYAGIIDSRESTYRTAHAVTGFALPIIVASAFRNIWNFFESVFEGSIDVAMIERKILFVSMIAPSTRFVAPAIDALWAA